MRDIKIDQAIAEFAEAAVNHAEMTQQGAGSKKINAAAEKVKKAYKIINSYGIEGKSRLSDLLQSKDIRVATMAASYLMHCFPDLSKKALVNAAKDRGLTGLSAKYALKRFDDDSWKLEFT